MELEFSDEEVSAIIDLLNNPRKPSQRLKDAVRDYESWITTRRVTPAGDPEWQISNENEEESQE